MIYKVITVFLCYRHVVLDEADRMLEMGFQEKVDEILKHAYTEGKFFGCIIYSFCAFGSDHVFM